MAYLTEDQIKSLNFKHIGIGVKISDKAAIYNHSEISIGDFSRIDDFCVISGKIEIGKYCHITPMCLLAGGSPGIYLNDYTTLAYGVKIFSQSDDYSGESMTNSLIPKKFKKEIFSSVSVGRFCIIGAGTIVLPGANILEGCSIGAMSLVLKPTEPWGIYIGTPVKKIKERSKSLLKVFEQFNNEVNSNDPV
jgi:acetyltransferase-like isoleucine patch superfamily enzyme